MGHWQMRGYGHWAVEEKASGRMIGRIGFLNPEGWPGFEIGWTLASHAWGKGYATEGGKRALAYAFKELDQRHVISLIHPDNKPSMRVAERLGEKLEGTRTGRTSGCAGLRNGSPMTTARFLLLRRFGAVERRESY